MNNSFKDKVASRPGGENVKLCYSCGTCTAGCPVSEVNKDFNPRVYIKKILLGMEDEILTDKNIWMCIQCHRCVAHCPQNVKFADIMRVIRQLSVEKGCFDAGSLEEIEKIDAEMIRHRMKMTDEYLGRK